MSVPYFPCPSGLLLVHGSLFHDELDGIQRVDVRERVARHGNDVSRVARGDLPGLGFDAECLGADFRGRL